MEWFRDKAQDPRFLEALFASLERERTRATLELEKHERTGSLDEIRLSRGTLDGLKKIFDVIDGVRASENKKPTASGLVRRILSIGENNGTGS